MYDEIQIIDGVLVTPKDCSSLYNFLKALFKLELMNPDDIRAPENMTLGEWVARLYKRMEKHGS